MPSFAMPSTVGRIISRSALALIVMTLVGLWGAVLVVNQQHPERTPELVGQVVAVSIVLIFGALLLKATRIV